MGAKVFLSLAFIWHVSLAAFEAPYLKFCGSNQEQSVDSNQCDKGIWLRRPLTSSCICARGVWALTSDFCDDNAAIIVGDGHCFVTPFRIRGAKLIGNPNDPFQPKVYVAPKSLDVVYEVTESGYNTPIQTSDEILIIGINPRQVAQRRDYSTCIDLNPEDYSKPLHIYMTSRRSLTEWKLDAKKLYSCPTIKEYQHHIAYGEIFSNGRVQGKSLGLEYQCEQECARDIPHTEEEVPREISNRTRPYQQTYPDNPQDAALLQIRSTFPHRVIKTMEERHRELEEIRAQVEEVENHYKKEVNEQTLRMMHAHISSLLLNIHSPQVITREYRYFQQIRRVVEKTCPEEYVPKLVLKGLMRMFRQLLWETHDIFQHVDSGDEEKFHRTLERLKECIDKTQEPSVNFATYTESWKRENKTGNGGPAAGNGTTAGNGTAGAGNGTAGGPEDATPGPERCPVPLIFAVNGSYYNRTFVNEKENEYIKNISDRFQPHLKFNASQVDFVIESAWKIAMIGHYRCSKFFDDQTAIEFSHFFHQVQSFFNPRIVKRWYYHSSVDATFDIVQMIFPSYDLRKFEFGLDACLYGTQGFSYFDFNNLWIQRPKIPFTDNDLSQKKNVIPGAMSRLSTLDYAPDSPLMSMGKAIKPGNNGTSPGGGAPPAAGAAPAPAGRKKRSSATAAAANGYTLWNDQARCLENYMDPVDNKEFGYRLPEGCIAPVYDYSKF